MKKVFMLLAFAAAVLTASAQQNKPVLTVENFTGSVKASDITALRNKVIGAIQEAGRVNVVDVTNEAQLKAEEERRKRESAMNDAGRVAEMGSLMSNCILKGNFDNVTTTRSESTTKDGKRVVSYTTKGTYTLSVVDASNGTVIKQQTFDMYGIGNTDAEAEASALDVKKAPVKRFILNAFAVGGKVLAVDEQAKDKAKTVYIDLGSADGVKKGQGMNVFKVVEIAGEKSNKLIGELKVKEVMSAGRSLCEVKKGGDVILSELEKGTTLPVETKEEKSNFFKSFVED